MLLIAWTAREDAQQFLRAHPPDRSAWNTLKSVCANLQEVIAAGLLRRVPRRNRLTCTVLVADNDQSGTMTRGEFISTSMKSRVGLEGAEARSEQFFGGEDGTLLRDTVRICERWAGLYHKLLNTKSQKLGMV